jgi:hypothetical protein
MTHNLAKITADAIAEKEKKMEIDRIANTESLWRGINMYMEEIITVARNGRNHVPFVNRYGDQLDLEVLNQKVRLLFGESAYIEKSWESSRIMDLKW